MRCEIRYLSSGLRLGGRSDLEISCIFSSPLDSLWKHKRDDVMHRGRSLYVYRNNHEGLPNWFWRIAKLGVGESSNARNKQFLYVLHTPANASLEVAPSDLGHWGHIPWSWSGLSFGWTCWSPEDMVFDKKGLKWSLSMFSNSIRWKSMIWGLDWF